MSKAGCFDMVAASTLQEAEVARLGGAEAAARQLEGSVRGAEAAAAALEAKAALLEEQRAAAARRAQAAEEQVAELEAALGARDEKVRRCRGGLGLLRKGEPPAHGSDLCVVPCSHTAPPDVP